jgi:hypothetical protein
MGKTQIGCINAKQCWPVKIRKDNAISQLGGSQNFCTPKTIAEWICRINNQLYHVDCEDSDG